MLRCLAIVALLLLIGCADTTSDLPDKELGAGIPLPSHESSGLTEYVLNGSATEFRSNGAVDSGSALVLDGSAGGFEYGVYRFNPGFYSPDSVSVLLEELATSGAWVGIANFAAGSWEFDGPFTKQKTFVIDDPAYISPAGNLWVAVLTAGETATVNALSVRTVKPVNLPPVAAFISDVSSGDAPLTVQFQAAASNDPDGEIIEYAWDFDGDGLYEGFSDTSLASHTFTTPGFYQVKLRVTDDEFARGSVTHGISVNAVGNLLPVANLISDIDNGETPVTVNLDATGSSDPDGSIVVYDWDYDNDGVWDDYNAGSLVSHIFTTVGNNTAVVRVTDNSGGQSLGNVIITVHGWLPGQTVQTGLAVAYTSLEIVDGIPAVSYFAQNLNSLQFQKALDPEGAGWDVSQSIDATANVGTHSHMAIVNGNPAVAYYDNSNAHPKFIRSNDIDGVAWNMPVTVDSSGVAGAFNSLAVVDGNPAITYYVNGVNDLKYVRATDAGGTTWGAPVTVDSSGDVGQYTTLLVVNGQPAVSYFDNTSGDLKYARATDIDGVSWGTPVTVDSTGAVGQYASMAMVNGRPAIGYFDIGNSDLKFVRAADIDGAAWGLPQTLDSAGNVGQYTSLAVINGNPAMAYVSFDPMSNADLRYIASTDIDGMVWDPGQTIDASSNAGQYCSLDFNNGNPMISYIDASAGALKFIRRF